MANIKEVKFKSRANIANGYIISHLESMLEKAKEGEILAIAIATVNKDDSVTSSYEAGDKAYSLIGVVACLEQRLTSTFGFGEG
jgi:hypothetical protein